MAWACVLLGSAGPSRAGTPTQVARHQYQIAGVEQWTALPVDTAEAPARVAVVAGYRHEPSGALLAITRVDVASPDAWRQAQQLGDQIEDGIQEVSPGYRRLERQQRRLGKIPALDLAFQRRAPGGGQVVLMRFLFFRRYTLSLTLTMPERAYRRHRRAHQRVVASFEPFFES